MNQLQTIVFLAPLAIAWLNPFAMGPSSAMVAWLVSLVCIASSLWLLPVKKNSAKVSTGLTTFFAATSFYLVLHVLWIKPDADGVFMLLAWACFIAMSYVGVSLRCASGCMRSHIHTLVALWLTVAILSVGMALCQYLQIEHWFAPWVSQSLDSVPFANLRQRNQFATLCGVGLFALLYLGQTSLHANLEASAKTIHTDLHSTHWQALLWQALFWLAAGVLAFGNGMSSSRTGGLQWLLVVTLVFCWRSSLHRDVRHLSYGAVAMYAVATVGMPWFALWVGNSNAGLLGRAQEMATTGGGRMTLYSNVIDLIAMKPWFGWGWRELAYAHYSTHFDVRFMELLDNAHNLPLHLAVELGVPFALAFCSAIVWAIARSAPWRETDPTRQLAWGILMLIGVHSMVEYPLWYGPFLMTLGLCIGLLQRPKNQENSAVVQVFTDQLAIKYVAIALLCLTAYLAFDYHRVSQIYLSEDDRSALYRDDVMGAAKRSVVFSKHAQFAELVTTPVTAQTAPHVLELALKLIHFSPEPRVIEPLIESAAMLHFDDIAMFHLERYKAMYPKDYAAWTALK